MKIYYKYIKYNCIYKITNETGRVLSTKTPRRVSRCARRVNEQRKDGAEREKTPMKSVSSCSDDEQRKDTSIGRLFVTRRVRNGDEHDKTPSKAVSSCSQDDDEQERQPTEVSFLARKGCPFSWWCGRLGRHWH